MIYHILNGDALADKFPQEKIPGQIVVIREAFIEGPLSDEFSKEFWEKRASFVTSAYDADEGEYATQFLSQLKFMDSIQQDDEVYLWFEDDLFCQANMWFAVKYISSRGGTKFYRVFPQEDRIHWSGFGRAEARDLIVCFEESKALNDTDVALANNIWNAYVENNVETLTTLSLIVSKGFRFLPEVISAHLERTSKDGGYGRPQQTLIEILKQDKTNFYEICDAFWEKNAIYGFGDLQVLNMLKGMEIEFSEDMN
ncbi:MAG: DUF1835 domain-containing protein [Saprospiraceae bacterium]|uniref:DUF1835 domain-containing protein n=1 Tax=Candidatus Opimibacter skivensis TaxID=2982028 RepID=A0A9D7XQD1_9BACT|nr:DUF1835 domain-containing protein [Candidatus Opimibacter skivensis]